jgi:putative endonuclease
MDLDHAIATLTPAPAAYVLRNSEKDYLYKGARRDIVKRLKDHRAGRVSHTKNRRPMALVYFEYCPDFTEARKRENFFKTGSGRRFIMEKLSA